MIAAFILLGAVVLGYLASVVYKAGYVRGAAQGWVDGGQYAMARLREKVSETQQARGV